VAIKTTGALSILDDLVAEFGGTAPHALTEFYGLGGVTGSGEISMSDFYGTSSVPIPAYTTASRSATEIDEDGTETVKFMFNCVNVGASTTVSYGFSSAFLLDVLISTDGINFVAPSTNGGSMTVNGNVYELWIRAVADNITEGPQTFSVTLGTSDSAGTLTGNPSMSVLINDTSLTSSDLSAGTHVVRQFDGNFASEEQDVSLVDFGYVLELARTFMRDSIYLKAEATSTSWKISACVSDYIADGTLSGNQLGPVAQNFEYYTPAGVVTAAPESGVATVIATGAAGNQPDSFKFVVTVPNQATPNQIDTTGDGFDDTDTCTINSATVSGDATDGRFRTITGGADRTATFAPAQNSWQAVSSGQSIGVDVSLIIEVSTSPPAAFGIAQGFGGAGKYIRGVEIWARKAGYNDTMIAKYCIQIEAILTNNLVININV